MVGADKNEVIIEQYDLNINKIYRVKGAVVLDTDQGTKIMREYQYSEGKAMLVNCIMEHLKHNGFGGVDLICSNKNDRLISENQYANRYVIRDYYPGLECDLKSRQDVVNAAAYLARIHTLLKSVDLSFFDFDEVEAASVEKQVNYDSENMSEGVIMKNEALPEEKVGDTENCTDESWTDTDIEISSEENLDLEPARIIVPKKNIRDYLYSHAREMKRVRRYIGEKKRKNDFEVEYINSIGQFMDQPDKALEEINNNEYDRLYEECIINQTVMHGEFNQHNIIYYKDDNGDDCCAITGFEKSAIGIQIYDLYRLLRKVMEKNNWDYGFGKNMIDRYIMERIKMGNPVVAAEISVLYALLIFPEKLWKITDYYYNKRKSWMSVRMSEKLRKLLQQEDGRQDFINSFKMDYLM